MTAPCSRRTLLAATAAALGTSAVAGCLGRSAAPGTDPTTTVRPTDDAAHRGETATEGSHGTAHEHASGSGHEHEVHLDAPTSHATVRMLTEDGHHFSPHVTWVDVGGTVTWELESGVHSATAYAGENDRPDRIPEGGVPFDSGVLSEAGAQFEQAFETPGVYDYFCLPHESMGMVGSVVVGRPSIDGQPALAPPQASLPEAVRTALEARHERVREALGGDDGSHGGEDDPDSGDDHHTEDDHHGTEGEEHTTEERHTEDDHHG